MERYKIDADHIQKPDLLFIIKEQYRGIIFLSTFSPQVCG